MLYEPLRDAAKAAGIAECDDPNAPEPEGISRMEASVRRRRARQRLARLSARRGRTNEPDNRHVSAGDARADRKRPRHRGGVRTRARGANAPMRRAKRSSAAAPTIPRNCSCCRASAPPIICDRWAWSPSWIFLASAKISASIPTCSTSIEMKEPLGLTRHLRARSRRLAGGALGVAARRPVRDQWRGRQRVPAHASRAGPARCSADLHVGEQFRRSLVPWDHAGAKLLFLGPGRRAASEIARAGAAALVASAGQSAHLQQYVRRARGHGDHDPRHSRLQGHLCPRAAWPP